MTAAVSVQKHFIKTKCRSLIKDTTECQKVVRICDNRDVKSSENCDILNLMECGVSCKLQN